MLLYSQLQGKAKQLITMLDAEELQKPETLQ